MAQGAQRAWPGIVLDELPLSDGGSGFVDALVAAGGGEQRSVRVSGPLGAAVDASYGLINRGKTAIIELAAASGLALLSQQELDPLHTSSYGTGELIRAALDEGICDFIIGIGGSATNDGGAGIAEALGVRLLDRNGARLDRGGAALRSLARLDISGLDPRLSESRVVVASDVRNPLCGPEGAAAVYGPQKGATPQMVAELEAALQNYADVIERTLNRSVADIPGSGAAGGAGAGLLAFLQAQIRPGFDVAADATHLREHVRTADLVLTGEGRLDGQTAYGKGVGGLAGLGAVYAVPVIALVGGIAEGIPRSTAGLTAAFSILPGPSSLEDAVARAADYVSETAEAVLRTVLAASRLAAPSP